MMEANGTSVQILIELFVNLIASYKILIHSYHPYSRRAPGTLYTKGPPQIKYNKWELRAENHIQQASELKCKQPQGQPGKCCSIH